MLQSWPVTMRWMNSQPPLSMNVPTWPRMTTIGRAEPGSAELAFFTGSLPAVRPVSVQLWIPEGEVQTNAADMACTLRAHWRVVFSSRGHDADLLHTWISEEQATRTEESRLLGLPAGLRLRRRHIHRAIKLTGNT